MPTINEIINKYFYFIINRLECIQVDRLFSDNRNSFNGPYSRISNFQAEKTYC